MTAAQVPGAFPGSALAPLSLSGSPISAIDAAVSLNERVLGSQRQVNENRFWSSAPRYGNDPLPIREIFMLTLNTSQQINFISVELPRFPHRAWVQYLDESTNTWMPVQDLDTVAPVTFTITDSIPSRFTLLADQQGKMHPQHYGAGHWVLFKKTFRTVSSSKFRLVLVRVPGVVPLGRDGQAAPYSLGVRNCFFGFDATDVNLIPHTPFVSETEHRTFAGAVDALRSNLSYALRENQPHSVLAGGVWKSAPQPIRNAVVNFHVDARDGNGLPQIIDRFFVDPLYTGPKINLYYSDTPLPLAGGEAIDKPITEALHASTEIDGTGTGLVFPAALGSIGIDNSVLRIDASSPWWIGLNFQPLFGSTESTDHVVLAGGALRNGLRMEGVLDVRWSSVDLAWHLTYNGTTTVFYDTFVANQALSYVLAFDGSSLSVTSPTTSSHSLASSWDGDMLSEIRFGQDSGGILSVTGDYRLLNLVVKNEVVSSTSIQTFFANPTTYVTKSAYPYLDDDSTKGAILRYADAYKVLSSGYFGFVGGSLIDYDAMVWQPINRDFESRRGLLSFNPVKAAAFKFEFYDLSPQNYDSQTVLTRTVRLFPINTPTMNPQPDPTNHGAPRARGGAGAAVNVNSGPAAPTFSDAGTIGAQREGVTPKQFSPTEVMYAEDPILAERIRTGSSTDYMRWIESPDRFRFSLQQVHHYRFIDVKHDHRVAFFAGLKSLVMYRLDYIAEDDTDQYLEVFHDGLHITPAVGYESSTLSLQPGSGLYSDQGDSLVVQAMASETFASRRKIRAIQFATTQTDPFQMLFDSDFNDPTLTGWAGVGDATIALSPLFNSTIGTTVEVKRIRTMNTWDFIQSLFATWDDIPVSETWDAMEASGSPMGAGGIASLDYEAPSAIGRLYAAARVYSPTTLTWPLYLQIISEDGSIVAEAEHEVTGNAITEWYVGYTIGEGGAIDGHTWTEVEAAYATWGDIEGVLWRDIESSTLSLAGRFTARVVQKDASNDIFYVDNISLFDDPIVWDFSSDGGVTWWPVYDIKNNPRGIFVFPIPGYSIKWRARVGRSNCWISAVDVRPQYSELPLGIPFREGIERGNGNVGHWDHYNPILVDPRFKMWDKPIPEAWWFINRQWLMGQTPNGVFHPLVPPVEPVDPMYLEDVIVLPPAPTVVLGETLPAPE